MPWALNNQSKDKINTRNFDFLIDSGKTHVKMLSPPADNVNVECIKFQTLTQAIVHIEQNSALKTLVFSRNGSISIGKKQHPCIYTKDKISKFCIIRPGKKNTCLITYDTEESGYSAYNNEEVFPYIECLDVLPFDRILTLQGVRNIDKIFAIIEHKEDFRWVHDMKFLGNDDTERVFIHIWKK